MDLQELVLPMPPAPTDLRYPRIVAYDRAVAYALLRSCTPNQLACELRAGRFGERLSAPEAAELDAHLTAWAQRALGELPLRDALLVDERRGRRVFALICQAHTTLSAAVPAALAAALPLAPADLATLPVPLCDAPALATLAAAGRAGATLALLYQTDDYTYPTDLLALAPPLIAAHRPAPHRFVQPTGWRRRSAALLAAVGVALLGLPTLGGRIPEHPAGLPLALLTLALLVGIRAGWRGYSGSLCIWLIANLPGFRHGTSFASLWPALPLLAVGLRLLSRDRHVRAMWGWLKDRLMP